MPVVVSGRMLGVVVVFGFLLLGSPAAAAAPDWRWPLDGARSVSRPFDPPTMRYGPGHRGADLAGRAGQVVRAAGAGRISYAGVLAGRGVLVVVHGDLRTTYEPVTATVRVGQQIAAGEAIGRLDAGHARCALSLGSGGSCLHWGLRRGEVYLDPVRLVRAGPSRLLPLDAPMPLDRPAGALPPAPAAERAEPAPSLSGPDPRAAARPATEPVFSLRAADAAWGSGALAALVAGLVLLLRPRRPPDGPAAPPLPAEPVGPVEPVLAAAVLGVTGGLVDLTTERSRRRPEVA